MYLNVKKFARKNPLKAILLAQKELESMRTKQDVRN